MRARLAAALLALVLLPATADAADWPQEGYSPQQARFNSAENTLGPSNVDRLEHAWSHDAPEFAGQTIVARGRVHFGYGGGFFAVDGRTRTLSAATGRVLWDVPGGRAGSTPAYAYGRIYSATQTGAVRILDPATGAVRRVMHTDNEVVTSPTVARGAVYVASYSDEPIIDKPDPTVHAFDAKTGAELWKAVIPDIELESSTSANTVAYGGGRVFVPLDDHSDTRVVALDALTGALRWTSPLFFKEYNGGQPVLARGRIYMPVGNRQGFLRVLRASDGRVIGERPGGNQGTAFADGVGYSLNTDEGALYAWREAPFQPLFSDPDGQAAPTLANGVLFTSGGGFFDPGRLVALDAITGARLASVETPGDRNVGFQLSVADGMVFASGGTGIDAFRLGPP
jgi:outer membrane protein assembly factor BamB